MERGFSTEISINAHINTKKKKAIVLLADVGKESFPNFRLYCCSKKFGMLQKDVKSLLEQLQVCIVAKIVFGVRCTLRNVLGNNFMFWTGKFMMVV